MFLTKWCHVFKQYKDWIVADTKTIVVYDRGNKRYFFRPMTENEIHNRPYIERKFASHVYDA